jgi:quinol monooxygenase YgiN
MATMIVKHRVANFEAWKSVFDAMKEVRAQHGWLSTRVLRDATDPNLVTIINHARDLDGIKRYGASPELRTAMAKAGVQGPPEIAFCDDAGDTAY